MKKNFKTLPLRLGVGIVVLNKKNEVFVAKRIDNPKNFWQMPQGGVDKGEKFYEAAKRELKEETNIKSIKFIKEIDGFTSYLLPDELLGIIWRGKYKGQKQKFEGDEKEINIKTKRPEFLDWKWVSIDNITDKVVNFKFEVYSKIKEEIKKVI